MYSTQLPNYVSAIIFSCFACLTAACSAQPDISNESKTPIEQSPQQTSTAKSGEPERESIVDAFSGKDVILPEPHPLISNISARSKVSLNGKWNIVVDENDFGTRGFLGGPYYKDAAPVGDYELREYSFDERRQLNVPGDWNSQDQKLFRYRKSVWYARNVNLEKQEEKRYFLHFDGANYKTSVYVNGQPIGEYIGGYTAFNFDVSDALRDGQNLLVIRVNAELDDSTIPTQTTSDFFKYGGITRDINLVTVPKTFVQNYSLALQNHETGAVSGWVQLEGPDAIDKQVTITLPEAGISISSVTGKSGLAEVSFSDDLDLWSPKSPKLYDVTISNETSSVTDKIGFRTITQNGDVIRLNGKPVFMRGISMHDESYLKSGVAYDEADARAQLGLIKNLNGNFVRLAHYPHNEYAVKIADEIGLMVWSEIPIVSLIDWDNEETLEVAKNQIRNNIRRDRNRASIVMWSIGNETMPQSAERLAFLDALAKTVKEEDESNRLIAAALVGDITKEFMDVSKRLAADMYLSDKVDESVKPHLKMMLGKLGVTDPASIQNHEVEVMLEDKLGTIVDVIGYNQYFGWYYSSVLAGQFPVDEGTIREFMFPLMKDIRFRNAFGKPMIISEFGGGAKYGKRSDRGVLWSEEYQEKIYKYQLDMLARSESVRGISPWILKDFRSSTRNLNGIQDIYNRKGIVSEKGEKKLAFKVLQDHYAARKKSEANLE